MRYVIVTPAYNEEKYIGETIESVIIQTHKPLVWVIVDDGSKDNTAAVIKSYAARYPWIHYVHRVKDPTQSYYSSNVYALFEGIKQLQLPASKTPDYDFLAILDADITLPADYYALLLGHMLTDPKLGIASGNCADKIGDTLKKHLYDRRSCAKAVMVFRKDCYGEIGGFVPMKYGGEDTVACFAARMKGWKTWAYHELMVIHNKPLGTGPSQNILKIRFRQGMGEFFLGSHPLFVLIKALRRCLKERPFLSGGLMRLSGFIYAHFLNEERQIPDDLLRFIRQEHLGRVLKGNKIPGAFKVAPTEIKP